MFLIEIRKIAFRYQSCCMIFFAETAKLRIQAYKVLEDITSIIPCQEKKLCLSYAICSYSVELDDSNAFLIAISNLVILIKAYRIYSIMIILRDKDNFARSGMKT